MLFVVEGLFGGSESEVKPPRKWKMAPFNGDWTNSIFMSLDQVALESVCYDFLRTEFNGVNQPEAYPNWVGVDDYLHQAADKTNWPAGITYNPDGKGELKSLGIHEHWNDAVNKQYSRNLGQDKGIELKKISGKVVSAKTLNIASSINFNTYPNPFTNELTVSFSLNEPAQIEMAVYDLQGKLVKKLKNEFYQTGNHEVRWHFDENQLSPGTYILSLSGNSKTINFNKSQKIQLVK
jgi:hypothetical protein